MNLANLLHRLLDRYLCKYFMSRGFFQDHNYNPLDQKINRYKEL